jgi:hypothetical protein
LAEEAVTAGNSKGDNNAIAYLDILDRATQFNDLPHKFMTEDVSRFH